MNDPPGVPSALGIEAVEWIAEGGENLTVRVTGRWRRRRPAWSGQPMLVIEAPGRRYRFPAMPEPPSLTGTSPGMWRISFSVPAALAPELGVRAWLQFGSVAVPLPAAVEFPGPETAEEEAPAAEPGAGEYAEPSLPPGGHPRPSSELESESARRRADEAEAALSELTKLVQHLEGELAAARSRADELVASLAAQQTNRRAAEQREHAERALRLDLARQLASRAKDTDRAREALGQLASAEERVRELEYELREVRRLADEAEQAAATAAAARDRARRQASQAAVGSRPALSPAEQSRLQFELALTARRSVGAVRRASEPPPVALAGPSTPAPEPARSESPAGPGADALISSLRRELGLRTAAEAGLRARLTEAEVRLAAREQLARQTTQTLSELRRELDGLRIAIEREREARHAAERRTASLAQALSGQRERSRDAYAAIGELRGTLESLRQRHGPPAPPVSPPPVPPSPVPPPPARVAPTPPPAAPPPPPAAPAPPPPEPPAPVPPPPVSPAADPGPESAVDASVPETPPAAASPPETPPTVASPAPVTPPPGTSTARTSRARTPPSGTYAPGTSTAEVAPRVGPPTRADQPAGTPEATVEPERLNDALNRLRERIPSQAEEPAGALPADRPPAPVPIADTGRAWLEPIFRQLVRSDPERAGRLLVDLLPAQGAATGETVSFDLVLAPEHTIQVRASDGTAVIRRASSPRPIGEVDFQVVGTHAALARMLVAGWLRRRLSRRVARVRGERAGVAALEALIGLRADLASLHQLGVRFEPRTAMVLYAGLIDPALTIEERFSIAYAPAGEALLFLLVRNGAPLEVTGVRPAGRIAATIAGPVGSFERVVAGEPSSATLTTGDERPIALLRKWVKRAQSG
jgi:hypothetical protein